MLRLEVALCLLKCPVSHLNALAFVRFDEYFISQIGTGYKRQMEKISPFELAAQQRIVTMHIAERNFDARAMHPSRMPAKKAGFDVNALPAGAYVLNERCNALIPAPIKDGTRKPGQTLATCLEIRALYRSGTITLRGLRDRFKINTKQVQQILRGEWYTPQIRKAERLDETGERLSLMGMFSERSKRK